MATSKREPASPQPSPIDPQNQLAKRGAEDVEGHTLIVDPYSARELARARDRDILRQVEHHRLEKEAARRPLQPKNH